MNEKWEYKIDSVSQNSALSEDECLNTNGEDGWELITVYYSGNFGGGTTYFYFKRKKQ